MEAVHVTFQAQVMRRGIAIRTLREIDTPIKDSDRYAFLSTLSRNCAKSSPWKCFYAAVERAAETGNRPSAIKHLDEAEKILLTLVQVRHELETGLRVNYNDLRRSYLRAIGVSVTDGQDVSRRKSPSTAESPAPSEAPRRANNEAAVISRNERASSLLQERKPESVTRDSVAAKPQTRRARTNENYDVFERLRAALAQWNYSPVFSTLSIVVFAVAAYFSASLFVDHRPADTAALASVLKPTAMQLSPTEAPLPAEVPPAEATAPIEAAAPTDGAAPTEAPAPTKPAAPPKASVPTKPAPDAPTQVSASSRMARIVRGVNLRAEPGGDVVTTLPRSQKVVVI